MKFLDTEEETEFELEEIRAAFEDYIGLIIVGFEAYDDAILDIEEGVIGKYVSEVNADREKLHLKLVNISGQYGGSVSLRPTITGQFSERVDDGMMPNWAAKYKITFVGGACIEYTDTHSTGSVSYSE
jgi:hypothetical protein